MAKMYLMSGPSGAGKTTFAKKFAADNGLQYFGIDDFYRIINGSEHLHEDETDVWLIFFKALHLAQAHGRDIIVDTNSQTAAKRTEFLDWFPSFEHHLIFVTAPFKLCKENNDRRSRHVPEEELFSIYRDVERPTKEEDVRWKSILYFVNRDNSGFEPVEV